MKRSQIIFHLKLAFSIFFVCFAVFTIGSSMVFNSILLSQLREPTTTIKLTREEESWIASIPVLISPIGILVIGILSDKIGRKKTLQISSVPIISSWLLIAFANSYATILMGRIILGVSFGITSCMLVYIAETCPAKNRSLYATTVTLFSGLGMFFECVLFMCAVHWRTRAAVYCTMCIVNVASLFFVPETSMWLRANGRTAEADRVDEWFGARPFTDKTRENAADASVVVEPVASMSVDHADKSYWSTYLHRTVWKPSLMMFAFFVLQQGSGIVVLHVYSVDMLKDCRVKWDAGTVTMYLSVARTLGGLCFAAMHHVNRRTVLTVSAGCMACSLAVVVAHLRTYGPEIERPPFAEAVFVALVVYMFFALLGIFTMPWILSSEVFPMKVKGVMNGVIQAFGNILSFTVCKIYPSMISRFGVENVWSTFAVFCVLSVLFAIFIMPETQGKSLEEILLKFESRKKCKENETS